MRILVCGGRDFWQRERLYEVLDDLTLGQEDIVIISGRAKGADTLAIDWAEEAGVDLLKFPADWEKHGRRAGPIRNQQMLDEGRPDIVVAFPGGKGTADMIERARKAGVEVIAG